MAILSTASCGADNSGPRSPSAGSDRPSTTPAPAATTAPAPAATTAPAPRSAPRWETVTTFSGTGTMQTPEFAVLPEAIQWRVRWSCQSGDLTIRTTPPSRRRGPMVNASCPQSGEGFSILTGMVRIDVEASGPWKAIVDQQVDIPLNEPAPAGLAGAPVIGEGMFYGVEKSGKGTARLYRLADGRRVLRFEEFEVSNNVDLFVWLTNAPRPGTSAEAVKAERVVLGNLKSTVGNQNYEVPATVPAELLRSVVIWCEPVAIVYSAAALADG